MFGPIFWVIKNYSLTLIIIFNYPENILRVILYMFIPLNMSTGNYNTLSARKVTYVLGAIYPYNILKISNLFFKINLNVWNFQNVILKFFEKMAIDHCAPTVDIYCNQNSLCNNSG